MRKVRERRISFYIKDHPNPLFNVESQHVLDSNGIEAEKIGYFP